MLNNMFYQKMCYGGQIKFTGPKKGKDQGLGVRKQITKPVTKRVSCGLITEYPDGSIETVFFNTKTRRITHPDGTIERFYADGTVEITDKFGNRTKKLKSGNILTKYSSGVEKRDLVGGSEEITDKQGNKTRLFPDGNSRITYISGEVAVTYKDTGTTRFEDNEGNVTKKFRDDTIETKYPDGSTTIVYGDTGKRKITDKFGNIIIVHKDTGKVVTRSNQNF